MSLPVISSGYGVHAGSSELASPAWEDQSAPLSTEQEQIWLHGLLAPELPLYNEVVTLRYAGELDPAALQLSLLRLRERHQILRTTMDEEQGGPVQRIGAANPIEPELADVSGLAGPTREDQLRSLVDTFARRPFDLRNGPLLRALVIRCSERESLLCLALHHIIFDGLSLQQILVPQLIELYNGYGTGEVNDPEAAGVQYADYARWQKAKTHTDEQASLSYWRAKLANLVQVPLPVDRAWDPETSYHGDSFSFAFDDELSASLSVLARQHRTTIFNVLLASFVLLLARLSDTTDIALGTAYAVRPHSFEHVLGCFVNTLILRTDLSGDPSFAALLKRTRDVTLEALEHAEVPFHQVVHESDSRTAAGGAPINVVFAFQPPPSALPNGWQLDIFEGSTGTAKFDLQLEMEQAGDHLRGRIIYKTRLFDEATIASMERSWAVLLRAAVRQPHLSVWELPLLTAEDQAWLCETLNQSQSAVEPLCMHDLFSRRAMEAPDQLAVSAGGRTVTYAELDRASASLAHRLLSMGLGAHATVGLMVERSTEMLAAILGILRSGATYLPLDPRYPTSRLEHMLQASGASLLLTQSALQSHLAETAVPRMLLEDCFMSGGALHPAELPQVPLSSSAYIIFTSGSTGTPKGVEIPHRALSNLLCSMETIVGVKATDALLAVASICFDISILELLLPLVAGGRVEIASAEEVADPVLLAARIQQSRATLLQGTPSPWHMLIESGWKGAPEARIICGGEAMSESLARQLRERCAVLWNMYGPTETTVISAGQAVTDPARITLGKPIANTQLYVLDSHQQLVPPGVSGELYIGGAGLAIGYHGQPELTRDKFPLVRLGDGEPCRLYRTGDRAKRLRDGSLVFGGRMDRQVKLNGFRIELGEVEQALNALPEVQESVVLKLDNGAGDILAGFVIPKAGYALDVQELRAGLSQLLPRYMQPAKLHVLTEVPLTPNGKLDRKRLPELLSTEKSSEAELPLPGTEQLLSAMWCDLLQIPAVGRRDNFFDLGGHSLLAARFLSRANRSFGRNLSLSAFTQAPTIAQFARLVEGHATPNVQVLRHGSAHKQLLWIGADPWMRLMAQHLHSDVTMYAITLDSASFVAEHGAYTIEAMAAHLVSRIRDVQAHGPYILGGFCIQGLLALEVAQQLTKSGEHVALLVMTDLYAPGSTHHQGSLKRLTRRVVREAFHLSRMRQTPIHAWAPYWQQRWNGTRSRRKSLRAADDVRPELQEALYVAESRYRPLPYTGNVLFLESDEGRLLSPTTSKSWAGLLSDIDLFQYPGDHLAMLKEPGLGLASVAIQQAIDRVCDRKLNLGACCRPMRRQNNDNRM